MIWEKLTKAGPEIYSFGDIGKGAPYDTKAKVYEFLVSTGIYNKIAWGTQPDDYTDFAMRAINESKGPIIDIGCGGLTHTAKLYAKTNRKILLVDNSIEMLTIAKKRLNKINGRTNANVCLLLADALNLPFSETYDNLFSFGMLHLFEDKQAYLESIFKTLKKGGKFFISSLTNDRSISRKYIELLKRNKEMATGLSSEEIKGLLREFSGALNSYTVGSMVFLSGTK